VLPSKVPLTEVVHRVAQACLRAQVEDQGSRHWGDALLIWGMLEVYRASGEGVYLDYALAWLRSYMAAGVDTERWVWGWAGLAVPALWAHEATGEEAFRRYALDIARALVDGAPRTRVGGITPHPRRPELWVDVPFFVAPALAAAGQATGEALFHDEAARQVLVHARHLAHPSGLFFHVWNEETGERSPCLWGRGNGWLFLAMIEALERLPPEHGRRGEVCALLQRQTAALASLQDAGGLWHTVLDRSDSYLETSCSAMFVYGLAKGVRLGLLPRDYLRAARLGWLALQDRVTWDGQVMGVSAQTPPGPFEWYQSIPRGREKFGTGLFLMAGVEMARL